MNGIVGFNTDDHSAKSVVFPCTALMLANEGGVCGVLAGWLFGIDDADGNNVGFDGSNFCYWLCCY